MDTIKFANGAVYECSFLSTLPEGKAFIAIPGLSFAQAVQIFSDPNMTSVMEWGEYRLVGYTTLAGLYVQPYGIQAVLTGGHDEKK